MSITGIALLVFAPAGMALMWLYLEIRNHARVLRITIAGALMGSCVFLTTAVHYRDLMNTNIRDRTAIKNLVEGLADELEPGVASQTLCDALRRLNERLVTSYDGPSQYEGQVRLFLDALGKPYKSAEVLQSRPQQPAHERPTGKDGENEQ